jgi:hypothetical protein
MCAQLSELERERASRSSSSSPCRDERVGKAIGVDGTVFLDAGGNHMLLSPVQPQPGRRGRHWRQRGLNAGALPLNAWQWSRPALGRDTAEVRGPAFGRATGMPPKEEPGSGSAGTGLGKANGRVEDPGGEGPHADPDQLGHPPLCRRGLSPTATTSMQLLPIASGEKNRSTSSSKNVSPVAPMRCAYDAKYTLPATVPASSCAAR